jgi:hypothetical protein
MMLKGEAIRVVLNHVFYADGCAGTTVGLSGGAIPPHLPGKQSGGRNRSSFPHRLPIPQVSQSPDWGGREPNRNSGFRRVLPARVGTGFESFELIVGLTS